MSAANKFAHHKQARLEQTKHNRFNMTGRKNSTSCANVRRNSGLFQLGPANPVRPETIQYQVSGNEVAMVDGLSDKFLGALNGDREIHSERQIRGNSC